MKIIRKLALALFLVLVVGFSQGIAQDRTSEHKLVEVWRGVVHSLDDHRTNDALTKLEELNNLKLKIGQDSLRAQSQHLLSVARQLKEQGLDLEAAKLAEAAIKLSPLSLGTYLGASNFTDNLDLSKVIFNLREMIAYDPASTLSFIFSGVYPFLWASVFSCLLGLLIYFTAFSDKLIAQVNKFIPNKNSSLPALAVLLFILLIPLAFGPIWTLLVWSLIYLLSAKGKRWIVFIAGSIILLWGAVIPIRENVYIWLEDPRMNSTVEVLSGSSTKEDFVNLQRLLGERPTDGVLYYAVGQYLRRRGQLDDSLKAFNRSEIILGNQPYTRAQRGIIELARGDYEKADKLLAEAEQMGLKTAAFYYNRSKAKIMNLDTEGSTEYYAKAKEQNSLVTKVLDQKEDVAGVDTIEALGEINLPFNLVLRSALTPVPKAAKIHDAVAGLLMPGASPTVMLTLGLFLLVAALVFSPSSASKVREDLSKPRSLFAFRKFIAFIPGAGETISGMTVRGFIAISVVILSIFPYIGWPKEFLKLFGGIRPDLFSSYGLTTLIIIILASRSSRKWIRKNADR